MAPGRRALRRRDAGLARAQEAARLHSLSRQPGRGKPLRCTTSPSPRSCCDGARAPASIRWQLPWAPAQFAFDLDHGDGRRARALQLRHQRRRRWARRRARGRLAAQPRGPGGQRLPAGMAGCATAQCMAEQRATFRCVTALALPGGVRGCRGVCVAAGDYVDGPLPRHAGRRRALGLQARDVQSTRRRETHASRPRASRQAATMRYPLSPCEDSGCTRMKGRTPPPPPFRC
jgi:hypothetical protein